MDLTFGDPLVSSNNLLAESLVFFQTGMIAPKNQAHKHTTNWSMAYVAFFWLSGYMRKLVAGMAEVDNHNMLFMISDH